MIGYCYIPGVMVETNFTIGLPPYGGIADIPPMPAESFPAENVSLLGLAHSECLESLLADHLPDSAQTLVSSYLNNNTPFRHAFLRFASERPSTGTYPYASADFLATGLRICFGACIDSASWHCFFEPTAGPFYMARPDAIPWGIRDGRFETFRTFQLTNGDLPRLTDFLALLSRWRGKITTDPVLRIALRYLTRSMRYRENVYAPAFEDHVLSSTIALEALLSPSDNIELKFRIAQNAANLVGRTAAERDEIFSIVTAAYDVRSKVAHGTFSSFGENFLNKSGARDPRDFAHRIRHIARESFARMAALFCSRADVSRKAVLRELEQLGRRSLDSIAGLPGHTHYTCAHPVYDDPLAAGLPQLPNAEPAPGNT